MIGTRQWAVIERASRSKMAVVVPRDYLERRALRRLQARRLARRVWGFPDLWRVGKW